ncbi:steryl-sulfatase-like [Saccostrea echinata]|uniref:steryl-sulfatase-like n=1 Tax=Saccostrea echinata TaxID=191078 RepID=UPI002A8161D6|nr:steryl-sulfatase-like [Saccostrea echinata]
MKFYVIFLITILKLLIPSKSLHFKPNIVIFLADDLGYGDVGVFGNSTVRTPNIDALAHDGIKLTHHLAAASVCTPSRSALLTGRLPIRTGMFPDGRIVVNVFAANGVGLPTSEVTLAEVAKTVDYKTALVGKWHLGLNKDYRGDMAFHPRNRGFDFYYGHILTNMKDWSNEGDRVLLSQRPNIYKEMAAVLFVGLLSLIFLVKVGLIGRGLCVFLLFLMISPMIYIVFVFNNMTRLNGLLYRDFELVEQPIHLETLSYRYTQESIKFLKERERDNNPFLLVVSWDHVHTALKTLKKFRGKSQHGRYGDAIEEIDSGIGDIMNALDKFGFGRNTMIYFTSDNGAHLEETGMNGQSDGGSNSPFRGGKAHPAVDGGIRVPTVIRFPGVLPRGKVIEEPTQQMDMFNTIVGLIGGKIPKDRILDGKDILPLLQFKESKTPNPFMFHYCGPHLQAVRYRPDKGKSVWKLVSELPNYKPGEDKCYGLACSCSNTIKQDPPLLYDMTSDPGERNPINYTSNPTLQKIVEKITDAISEHKKSVGTPESRMTFFKLLWRPWFQPCCNFPSCSCSDPLYKDFVDQ